MSWYYAVKNQQIGPITEADIERLVGDGTITTETLVWREGMADWQPYAQVQAELATAAETAASAGNAAPRDSLCSECGRLYPTADMVLIAGNWVCATCKPAAAQMLRESVPPDTVMRYGGFWIRLLAKFADGCILAVANLIIGALLAVFVGLVVRGGDTVMAKIIVIQVLGLCIQTAFGAAYTTFFLGKFGATPGKMACGLKVITAEGGPVSYTRALGRHFAEMLSGLILFIGYIMAAFDPEKRTLHDRICNTRVVKK